jgi:predicted enzyme related to lactoylglutathione lyase
MARDVDRGGDPTEGVISMFTHSQAFSGFAVKELDAAKTFYGDTLGLEVKDEPMGTLGIELGTGATVMVYRKPDFVPATYTILNFPVADVDAAVDQLTAAGVTMERYPGFDQDEKGISRGRGPTIAWFKDPSGNILAVLEEARG